jgi:hypothetical protein
VLTDAGWVMPVSVVALLAVLPMGERYEAAHPEVTEQRAVKEQAKVDAILARYEAEAAERRARG